MFFDNNFTELYSGEYMSFLYTSVNVQQGILFEEESDESWNNSATRRRDEKKTRGFIIGAS